MLRTALLIIAALVCAAGLVSRAAGHPAGAPAAIWGGLLLAAILAERWRYRQAASRFPGEGWVRTGERFIDPETGSTLQVWYDPRTGERRYLEAARGQGNDGTVPSDRKD